MGGWVEVSIRAPAWGGDEGGRICRIRERHMFQSAPPRGGRPGLAVPPARRTSFNPRPRVGGDPEQRMRIRGLRGFNPRPRVGGDQNLQVYAGT